MWTNVSEINNHIHLMLLYKKQTLFLCFILDKMKMERVNGVLLLKGFGDR